MPAWSLPALLAPLLYIFLAATGAGGGGRAVGGRGYRWLALVVFAVGGLVAPAAMTGELLERALVKLGLGA